MEAKLRTIFIYYLHANASHIVLIINVGVIEVMMRLISDINRY